MGRYLEKQKFLMRTILIFTILACSAMFSIQMTDERRMALTQDYNHARRMGFKMPTQFCQPAKDAGVFILDTAIMCAVEAIIPGSGKIADAIKAGKKVADKLGVMAKITELKTKAENWVLSKFLGIFGCKVRRRVFGLGNITGAISSAAGAVGNAVKSAGSFVLSKAKDAAGAIGAAAKAAAKVVCPVIKPMCPGACGAALTAFKTAGTVLAATYHIPLNCLSGALEKGCKGLCTAICGSRLVTVRVHHHHRGLKGKKAKKHHKKAAAKRELRKKHKKAAAKKAAAKRDLFGLPSMDRLKSCAGTAGCALKVTAGGVMGAIAALTGGCLTTVKKCVFGRRMSKKAAAKLGAALKKKVAAHKKAAAAAKRELRRHLRRHLGKKEKVVAAIKKKVAAQ